jgi:hypothetical protein
MLSHVPLKLSQHVPIVVQEYCDSYVYQLCFDKNVSRSCSVNIICDSNVRGPGIVICTLWCAAEQEDGMEEYIQQKYIWSSMNAHARALHTHTHTHISAFLLCTSLLSIRSTYSHIFSDLLFVNVEINETSSVMWYCGWFAFSSNIK